MWFLTLFCSIISVISASDRFEAHKGDWQLREFRNAILNCTADSTWLGTMHLPPYDSFGIRRRDYSKGNFVINPATLKQVEKLLVRFKKLTLKKKIELANEEFPELKKDIENYVAVITRPLWVYLQSARYELKNKRQCITEGTCEVDMSNDEALFLLNKYEDKIRNLVHMGSWTDKDWLDGMTFIDGSKLLSLKCNFKCVQKEYREWTKTCSKDGQQKTTEFKMLSIGEKDSAY